MTCLLSVPSPPLVSLHSHLSPGPFYRSITSHLLESSPLSSSASLQLHVNPNPLTVQPCGLRVVPYCTRRAPAIRPNTSPAVGTARVCCSHIADCHPWPRSAHPYLWNHINQRRPPLKAPRYIPQWRLLYVPAESDGQTDSPLQASPHMPWTPGPASRKQVSEVWREQKQLWEACLHWPAATVTVDGPSNSSPGAIAKGVGSARNRDVCSF